MALFQCDFKSHTLQQELEMNIIMPTDYRERRASSPPAVLYLLHGLSDNHTAWQRKTRVEQYAADMNMAIVMPNVHRSFYLNTATGYHYFDFMAKELPKFIADTFNVSTARKDTFVAGLSMGGFGAFMLALSCPEMYSIAVAMSGALYMARSYEALPKNDGYDIMRHDIENVYGAKGARRGGYGDLFTLAKQCATAAHKPILRQYCGTEDFLYNDNLTFRDFVESLSFNYEYSEWPGEHNWDFWDIGIVKAFECIREHNQRVNEW